MEETDGVLTYYRKLVNEICEEEKIKISWVSNDWVGILEKDGIKHRLFGYKSDLNPAAATMIADDKFATFDVLQRARIPIIEHALLYAPTNHAKHAQGRNSPEYVAEYLAQHQNSIVIKPNDGTQGKGVIHLSDAREIDEVLSQTFARTYSASMCPFYEIEREYRLVILDGEEKLAYAKEKGTDWRFNLKQGAKAVDITDEELHQRLIDIAKRAVAELGLRFCSVDIIETAKHELLIMEVNSGVMIRHYVKQHPDRRDRVKNIYRAAIKALFTETP